MREDQRKKKHIKDTANIRKYNDDYDSESQMRNSNIVTLYLLNSYTLHSLYI